MHQPGGTFRSPRWPARPSDVAESVIASSGGWETSACHVKGDARAIAADERHRVAEQREVTSRSSTSSASKTALGQYEKARVIPGLPSWIGA